MRESSWSAQRRTIRRSFRRCRPRSICTCFHTRRNFSDRRGEPLHTRSPHFDRGRRRFRRTFDRRRNRRPDRRFRATHCHPFGRNRPPMVPHRQPLDPRRTSAHTQREQEAKEGMQSKERLQVKKSGFASPRFVHTPCRPQMACFRPFGENAESPGTQLRRTWCVTNHSPFSGYPAYPSSPCWVVSSPSRSSWVVTRRPIALSTIFTMITVRTSV